MPVVERGGTTQRLARALAGVALVLAVSGCTGASPSATGSSRAPAPSATSRASWTATGGMTEARADHTATLLPDGKVLVAGGQSWSGFDYPLLASAELYDAASGSWSVIGEMTEARADHTATLLPDGKVLVAGGYGDGYLASAELYDPITRSWVATGSMDGPRYDHTATLLPDGKVLVTGGAIGGGDTEVTLASVEVYDPSTASWTDAQEMNAVRYRHTATLLLDGTVLVAGGIGPDLLASAELYDPGSGSWTTTGSMNGVPWEHTATLLLDGTVLVTGGCCSVADATAALASAELYDPANGSWTAADSMNGARAGHTVTRLPDGWVVMVGGDGPQAFAELYDPGSRSWTATAEMIEGRGGHTATLLVDGRMLVAGGFGRSSSVLASAELFDPGSDS